MNCVKIWRLNYYFSTFGVLIILLFVLVYKCNLELPGKTAATTTK